MTVLTPPSITYFTPLPEEDDLAESKDMSKISGQIRNLQISAPASSSLSSGVVTDGIALGPELPQPQSIAESVVSMPRDKTPEHESAQPTTESSRIKTVIDSEVSQGASSSNRTSLCTGPAESILGDDHFADPSDSTLSDDAFMLMIEEEESLEQQSDITYSKAFDLERRAVFEARGSWVKSTRANKDAIDKYILLEGHDSRNACCIRVDLARAFSQQGRHEESIIMLRLLVMDLALLLQVNPNYENIAIARRVMASCQKMLSSFWPQKTDISLRIAVLIGGAFITRGEIEGAIHFLRDTIDVYQDLGLHDIQSRIKLAFARMLKDRGHIREALKLPQDIFISQLISGLEGRPPTRDIADILVSLRTLYASFVESEYWAGVTQVLSKMVETATSSPEWGLEPFPKLLYQAMNLAGRFSALGERKHAESVFSVGLAKLEGQSTIMVAAWKAATCHWYANHMRREGDVLKTAFYLAKTIQILVRINRHRGRLAAQARTELTKALASAKTLGLNRSLKFAPIYVMIRQSEEAIANGNRRSVATTCDLTEEWDDALSLNTVSTKSIRYGTTCSETDFLGYDIEEFRRP
jgi:tetratricopeptide (TPR) repeat protein